MNPFTTSCAYITSPPPHDLPSIMVALFEPLWVSYWQGGGMVLRGGSTATVSSTSYTSCSTGTVSGCTWGPLQPDNAAHVKVWAMAHTSTLLSSRLHHSPTHPTPTHVAGCSLCVLLVTMVHLFDPLLPGQSIRHGNHGGGLISCHHDHQHLWLLIMNFRMYVSGLGLALSTRLEHCPLTPQRTHDLKLTL